MAERVPAAVEADNHGPFTLVEQRGQTNPTHPLNKDGVLAGLHRNSY